MNTLNYTHLIYVIFLIMYILYLWNAKLYIYLWYIKSYVTDKSVRHAYVDTTNYC